MRSCAEAAMVAGSAGIVRMEERTVAAMSSIFSGRSSRKRSMAQSATVQDWAVLLHVSLMRCCPNLADECWKMIGLLLMQASRFCRRGLVDIFPRCILAAA